MALYTELQGGAVAADAAFWVWILAYRLPFGYNIRIDPTVDAQEVVVARSVGKFLESAQNSEVKSACTNEYVDQRLAVIPFFALRKLYNIPYPLANDTVNISRDFFLELLRVLAGNVSVDERWYREIYPDIDKAIRNGRFADARDHYVRFGYLEDRVPSRPNVDEEFYLNRYPDVKKEIQTGHVQSVEWHFMNYGYREGRIPSVNWKLDNKHGM